jgi:hypothetical protein
MESYPRERGPGNAGRGPLQQGNRVSHRHSGADGEAHVAKLLRKVGVQNRIALSIHAITHSLVTAK